MAEQPWHELPAEVAVVLRPHLASIADEIIDAVRTVPAYARPMEGAFGEGVRAGVQQALRHFLAEIEAGGPVERPDVYTALGRGEMRAGRSLDSLLSAYRIGARVAWRRFAGAGERAGLEPATLYAVAESIFAYIDVLSAQTAAGHSAEQTAIAGEVELARRRLVRLLVREPAPDPTALAAAASEAGLELPRSLAVLAVSGARSVRSGMPLGAIAEAIGELECVIVPDPDAPVRRAALERAVREAGVRAGLGTTVAPGDAAVSFARARGALSLAEQEGVLVDARAVAGELLVRSDRRLAEEFAASELAPLAALPAASRTRMAETLHVWLAQQGRLAPVAQRLGVHPQTARYRIARLRELFAGALDDPDRRFWLALALYLERRR